MNHSSCTFFHFSVDTGRLFALKADRIRGFHRACQSLSAFVPRLKGREAAQGRLGWQRRGEFGEGSWQVLRTGEKGRLQVLEGIVSRGISYLCDASFLAEAPLLPTPRRRRTSTEQPRLEAYDYEYSKPRTRPNGASSTNAAWGECRCF